MNTPENITKLKPNEIICVGTNMLGQHAGGLALYAHEHFGLETGHYSGLCGQCYCIPTLDESFKRLSLTKIHNYLLGLKLFALSHKDKTIYLTKIGCGIAGFSVEEIKSILPKFPENVILPVEFEQ